MSKLLCTMQYSNLFSVSSSTLFLHPVFDIPSGCLFNIFTFDAVKEILLSSTMAAHFVYYSLGT
jgi:hypothetical protein